MCKHLISICLSIKLYLPFCLTLYQTSLSSTCHLSYHQSICLSFKLSLFLSLRLWQHQSIFISKVYSIFWIQIFSVDCTCESCFVRECVWWVGVCVVVCELRWCWLADAGFSSKTWQWQRAGQTETDHSLHPLHYSCRSDTSLSHAFFPSLSLSLSLHDTAMLTGSARVSDHLLIQVNSLSARESDGEIEGEGQREWQREKERNKSGMNNGEVVVLFHLLKTHPNSGHRSHINSQKQSAVSWDFSTLTTCTSFAIYTDIEKKKKIPMRVLKRDILLHMLHVLFQRTLPHLFSSA